MQRLQTNVQSLLKTRPFVRSELLEVIPHFDNVCRRSGFSGVALGEGNTDWLVTNGLKNQLPGVHFHVLFNSIQHILLNSSKVETSSQNIFETFIPLSLVMTGPETQLSTLFEVYIRESAPLLDKFFKDDFELLRGNIPNKNVYVGTFTNVPHAKNRTLHILNLSSPKLVNGIFEADFSNVRGVRPKTMVMVDVSHKTKRGVFSCRFQIPINYVVNNYTYTYPLVLVEITCYTNLCLQFQSSLPLPLVSFYDFAKIQSVSRRGVEGMAVIGILLLLFLTIEKKLSVSRIARQLDVYKRDIEELVLFHKLKSHEHKKVCSIAFSLLKRTVEALQRKPLFGEYMTTSYIDPITFF